MKELSEGNTAKRLKFAGTIQGMENTEKNFRGKIQGLRRTDVVQARQLQDEAIKTVYKKGTAQGAQASKIVNRIQEIWNVRNEYGAAYYYGHVFTRQSKAFQMAELSLQTANLLKASPKKEKDSILMDFQNKTKRLYPFVEEELERRAFKEVANGILRYSANNKKLNANGKIATAFCINAIKESGKSLYFNNAKMLALLEKNPNKLLNILNKENTTKVLLELEGSRAMVYTIWRETELELSTLMPQYIGYREDYLQSQFIPDANSTLRLTYGYIKGYKPNDGEVHAPFTTLEGVFAKANTKEDYRLPEDVQDKLSQKNIPSVFKDPKTGKVVVGILYNLDTTGGNSGSPVLNARGELIGINFDRSFTATINDYAWNQDYSRSIGCDIRYVLYVLKYVSGADKIIDELGVVL
jgi:hypothetical protein